MASHGEQEGKLFTVNILKCLLSYYCWGWRLMPLTPTLGERGISMSLKRDSATECDADSQLKDGL